MVERRINMELTFSIDTDDLYGEDGSDFENLLTDSLRREIIKNAKDSIASKKFNEFARLASDTLIAEIKLKLENFLSEEIVLTGRYGEKEFVGSIEDLIKQRFDDILLRPVDSDGDTLKGCTSSGDTWIEWYIKRDLYETRNKYLERAEKNIKQWIAGYVDKKIIEIKDTAIKDQVDKTFASILKKG